MKHLEKIIGCGVIILGIVGYQTFFRDTRDSSAYTIETYPVDQIFRDHGGYRIYSVNEHKELIERRFSDNGGYTESPLALPIFAVKEKNEFKGLAKAEEKAIRIFKDLEKGEEGFAKIISWNEGCQFYLEVHLAEDEKLDAGISRTGEKYPRQVPMQEIK